MMKHDSPTKATVCGHCGFLDQKILHHVRIRTNFRRLCTTCVLRLHPQCFCPSCLTVYNDSPPDHAVVCYKCYSSTHRNCVSPPVAAPPLSSRSPSPTPCATCLNPNGLVFNPKKTDWSSNSRRAIDISAAKLLLAAAEISSLSMNKAEVAAVMEAERRAKEASYTKKRAREALDHAVHLMEIEKKERFNRNRVLTGNANNRFVAMPVTDNRISNSNMDASNDVSKALSTVELKESNARVVVNRTEDLGLKNESVRLVDRQNSLDNNYAMQP